ncbi:transcriptional repressor [Pedobacter rhizosphaerae]|uniref:Ferric uptake regulator family protein n=1 Tax=Pedobacter rhizosphaerae TaxID=390241 RepID=A0A1H9UQI0_9SPHI|nr:transcriptional repressor [Pedobacter rhizosphaerae]SES11652.1 Ferric uptake regulator family protein [Pedobacter rhizosphaerae]
MKNNPPMLTAFTAPISIIDYTELIKEEIIDKIRIYCRSRRMLSSEKRTSIALRLFEVKDFIHPETLWMMLKKENINVSIGCVYTNLRLMEEAGVAISRIDGNRLTLYRIR